jgi:hypothetical protein
VKVTFCICSFTCIIGKDEITLNSVRAVYELTNYSNHENSDTRKTHQAGEQSGNLSGLYSRRVHFEFVYENPLT